MDTSFMKLLQITDAFFPVGAFTLSNGLETYVQQERLRTPADLEAYLAAFLRSAAYNDLAVVARAWDYIDDFAALLRLDALAAASRIPREVREGARRMCQRFFRLAGQMGAGGLERYAAAVRAGEAYGQYAVAFGLYARAQGIAREDAVAALAYNAVSAVVNNCVKLVPLGQHDGQRILHARLGDVLCAARLALDVPEEEIGLALPGLDLRAIQHEHLPARQYMS